jgi:translation initiation factor IF-2
MVAVLGNVVFVFHTNTLSPQYRASLFVQKEARADAEEMARLQELEEAKEEWKEMDQTRREASQVERESKASLPWYARRKKKAVKRVSEDELYSHDKPRQSIIIKGDVQGSIEAICDMLEALPSNKGERTCRLLASEPVLRLFLMIAPISNLRHFSGVRNCSCWRRRRCYV